MQFRIFPRRCNKIRPVKMHSLTHKNTSISLLSLNVDESLNSINAVIPSFIFICKQPTRPQVDKTNFNTAVRNFMIS